MHIKNIQNILIGMVVGLLLWVSPAWSATFTQTYRFDKPTIQGLPGGVVVPRLPNTLMDDTKQGAPIVPSRTAKLVIPQGETLSSVKVTRRTLVDIAGKYKLDHARKPHPLSLSKTAGYTAQDKSIYQANRWYPRSFWNKQGVQSLLGHDVLLLRLYPVIYNPVQKKLKYTTTITVTVTTRPKPKGASQSRMQRRISRDISRVRNFVDNKSKVLGSLSKTQSYAPLAAGARQYLIITTESLVPTFTTLANHRASVAGGNYQVHIATVEDIASSVSGRDLPEKIRNYIKTSYSEYGTEYVLLGGDDDGASGGSVPARGCYSNVGGHSDSNIPTDLYYACLDGTWNNDNDSLWGESNDGIGGADIDWLPEVYVGRIACDNATEASNQISKIIAFETTQTQRKALMVGEKLDSTPTWGGDRMDWVYSYMGGLSNSKLYDRNGTWSGSSLITQLNSNSYHWVNHLGHSNVTYNLKLSTGSVNSLTNNKYFLLYSQGCYSGSFDNRSTSGSYYSSDSFGEVVTNSYSNKGAFAYIGNSRYGWYNPGSYVQGASNLIHKKFAEAIATGQATKLGPANHWSKTNVFMGSQVYRWIAFEANLLGDPATPMVEQEAEPDPALGRAPETLSLSVVQGQNPTNRAIEVYNAGGGSLSYSITDNASWISVTPTTGSSTGEHDLISVSFSTANLGVGTYYGVITITSAQAANSPLTIPVTLTVTAQPPKVSGKVLFGSNPLSGVTITASPGGMTAVTNANGEFSMTLETGYSGRFTPTKTGYAFTPTSKYLTNVTTDQSFNFTAQKATRQVTGRITFGDLPLPNVTITATPGDQKVVTNSGGYYSMTVEYGYSGRFTPSKTGYVFTPQSRYRSDITEDIVLNFLAGTATPRVSGRVLFGGKGLAGVTITAYPGNKTAVTNSNGYYAISLPAGYSGRFTPSKSGYVFAPRYRYRSNITENLILNYTAAKAARILKGRILYGRKPLANVKVYFTPGGGYAKTNSRGYFSKTVKSSFSGVIKPYLRCYSFSPSYFRVSAGGDRSNLNFRAGKLTRVYGYVKLGNKPLARALVSFTGGKKTYSNAKGYYQVKLPCNYSGTMRVTKNGYRISPTSVRIRRLASSWRKDFRAYRIVARNLYVKGYVTNGRSKVRGARLVFSKKGSVRTNSRGYYSKKITRGWSGTIVPQASCMRFSPKYIKVTNLSRNLNINIRAISDSKVIGRVTLNGQGLSRVKLTFAPKGRTVYTRRNGSFSVNLPCNWSGKVTAYKRGYSFTPQIRRIRRLRSSTTANLLATKGTKPYASKLLVLAIGYSNKSVETDYSSLLSKVALSSNSLLATLQKSLGRRYFVSLGMENSGIVNDGIVSLRLTQTAPTTLSSTSLKQLAYLALKAANSKINFADYDHNGDGRVRANELKLVILSAGDEQLRFTGISRSIRLDGVLIQ